MCIAVLSTAHPDYALIVVNNRDEFLSRPTKRAGWWDPPNANVLGGRDLVREEQGTWLGITREGRIAVLTNFREDGEIKLEARSRGGLVNAVLTQPASSHVGTEDVLSSLVENDGLKGIGGFSLIYGKVGEPLAVISNRTPDTESITRILKKRGDTIGLSNADITDRSWSKVTKGERLVEDVIKQNMEAQATRDSLIAQLFQILTHDTLPKSTEGKDWASRVKEMRNSIFIPAVGGEATRRESAQDMAAAKSDDAVLLKRVDDAVTTQEGTDDAYGTQKQTVILVTHFGKVTFIERTLFGEAGHEVVSEEQDRVFNFNMLT